MSYPAAHDHWKFDKVPAVTIDGLADPLKPGGTAAHAGMFIGRHEHRVADAEHNVPQEAPQIFAHAKDNITTA